MSLRARRSLLEIFRRARTQRDYLLDIIAKQRDVMLQQEALIRQQQAAMREMRDGVAELKAMAVRARLLDIAIDAPREEGSPLQ